jgi:hypothetical protein
VSVNFRNSKITNLELFIVVYKYVEALNVSVDNVLSVNVLQSFQNLISEVPHVSL